MPCWCGLDYSPTCRVCIPRTKEEDLIGACQSAFSLAIVERFIQNSQLLACRIVVHVGPYTYTTRVHVHRSSVYCTVRCTRTRRYFYSNRASSVSRAGVRAYTFVGLRVFCHEYVF